MDVTRLFEEHHHALCRYLLRFTGDADVAADVAQETFVRALERPPREGSARAWLYTVATNLARESARTTGRRQRLLDGVGGHGLVDEPSADPLAALEAGERRAVVQRALLALSEKERTALLMREEGFTHREIGAAVGAAPQGVGSLLTRALAKLADRLDLDAEDV